MIYIQGACNFIEKVDYPQIGIVKNLKIQYFWCIRISCHGLKRGLCVDLCCDATGTSSTSKLCGSPKSCAAELKLCASRFSNPRRRASCCDLLNVVTQHMGIRCWVTQVYSIHANCKQLFLTSHLWCFQSPRGTCLAPWVFWCAVAPSRCPFYIFLPSNFRWTWNMREK